MISTMISRQLFKRVAVSASAAVLAVGALAGCSQLASLGPVSGLPANTMQIAVDNVLVAQNVKVLDGVKCKQLDSKQVECKGSTLDNQPIVATGTAPVSQTHTMSPGGTPTAAADGILEITMTVKVGNKTIFEGPAQKVIEQNAVK